MVREGLRQRRPAPPQSPLPGMAWGGRETARLGRDGLGQLQSNFQMASFRIFFSPKLGSSGCGVGIGVLSGVGCCRGPGSWLGLLCYECARSPRVIAIHTNNFTGALPVVGFERAGGMGITKYELQITKMAR